MFYFLRQLERAEDRYLVARHAAGKDARQEVPFDLVELFVRRLRQQNIFVYVEGPNGKPESLLVSKVFFSMNRVVRLYTSISLHDEHYRFLRIRPHRQRHAIVVERIPGPHAQPEIIYQHRDQRHVIRWIVRWIVRHMDWTKTKLRNLDIYKLFVAERQRQLEQQLKRLNEEAKFERMISSNRLARSTLAEERHAGRREDRTLQ